MVLASSTFFRYLLILKSKTYTSVQLTKILRTLFFCTGKFSRYYYFTSNYVAYGDSTFGKIKLFFLNFNITTLGTIFCPCCIHTKKNIFFAQIFSVPESSISYYQYFAASQMYKLYSIRTFRLNFDKIGCCIYFNTDSSSRFIYFYFSLQFFYFLQHIIILIFFFF